MRKYCKHIFLIVPLFYLVCNIGFAQDLNSSNKNVVQKAHDKSFFKEDFTLSDNGRFYVKLFSVDTPKTNKLHHWFLQIFNKNEEAVNFGKVELTGFHAVEKSKKFNYINQVNNLCSQGKYVIGFIKLQKSGTWVLDLKIEEFGKKDTVTLKMEVVE